jgi:protein-arginine kinase
MSQATEDRQQESFAFGDNSVDGQTCPIVAATGCEPEGTALEVAETFDRMCQRRTGMDWGTVDKEVACELWRHMIDDFKMAYRKSINEDEMEWHEEKISVAKTIAEKVF